MALTSLASIYAKKVANGDRTIESVPDAILAEVKEILGITNEEETDE